MNCKGLTLVEVLSVVVIAFIVLATLGPLLGTHGAADSAKASAMKNKGRGIWIAVTSANAERDLPGSHRFGRRSWGSAVRTTRRSTFAGC